ncbi:hypothetical protein PSPO01_15980 [Paraphaeosphaeria sporulosa]
MDPADQQRGSGEAAATDSTSEAEAATEIDGETTSDNDDIHSEEDEDDFESDAEEISEEDETDDDSGTESSSREPTSSNRSSERHAAAAELLQLLFELCIAFMTEEFRDGQPGSSVLVYYSGILALQGNGETFRTAKLFTPILSQLIYIQRLLFLEYALPYAAYPRVGLEQRPRYGQLERLNEVRLKYMVEGAMYPLAEFQSLRDFGRVIGRTDPPSFLFRVEFFSQSSRCLGTRVSLEQEIRDVTGIPSRALRDQKLSDFSVDERMEWAAKRTTTVKEDKVYCLLGIFGVFLPLIYGEGEEYATLRLKDEIQKRQQGQGKTDLQDLLILSLLPFSRNELFAGRESQLQAIERTFFSSNTHRCMTIYGLGGCGKSALALEFAYRALATHARRFVFWVPAMSHESFDLAFREIGMRLCIPRVSDDGADVKQLVKQALSTSHSDEWLMIVDNADDPSVLFGSDSNAQSTRLIEYIPHSNAGSVFLTTRSRKAATELTQTYILRLEDIDQTEARQLLARRMSRQALLNYKALSTNYLSRSQVCRLLLYRRQLL